MKLKGVITQFGLLTVILAVIAVVLALILKKARKITLFCACSMIATMAAFFHVQSMGMHHIYTIAGEACILMILGIYQIIDLIHKEIYKAVANILIVVILGLGTLNCFFPAIRPVVAYISVLYAQKYDPMQRNDIEQLHNLADYYDDYYPGMDEMFSDRIWRAAEVQ